MARFKKGQTVYQIHTCWSSNSREQKGAKDANGYWVVDSVIEVGCITEHVVESCGEKRTYLYKDTVGQKWFSTNGTVGYYKQEVVQLHATKAEALEALFTYGKSWMEVQKGIWERYQAGSTVCVPFRKWAYVITENGMLDPTKQGCK